MSEKDPVVSLAQKLDPEFKKANDAHMSSWDRKNPAGPYPNTPQLYIAHDFRRAQHQREYTVEWWKGHGIKMQFVHPVGYVGPDKHLTNIEFIAR